MAQAGVGHPPRVDAETRARIWLSTWVYPGDRVIGSGVNTVGAVDYCQRLDRGIFHVGGKQSAAIQARATQTYPQIPPRSTLDATLTQLASHGITPIDPRHPHWPPALNDLGAATPWVIYARGQTSCLGGRAPRVSIVGTRHPSARGVQAAATISAAQIAAGRIVVSGGARGIDVAAQLVAVNAGMPTICVLAQSPHRPYPPEHRGVFDEMTVLGAVVSERPPGVAQSRGAFLARNRLIAALSGVTVVVEAPWRSGAVSTARHAAELGREVMGVVYPNQGAENAGVERILQQWAGQAIDWPS